MATVTRRSTRPSKQYTTRESSGSRRGGWKLLLVLVALGGLVAAGPTVLVQGPWRNGIINWALADLKGSVSVGRVSLGWFTPLAASDISLKDEAGNRIAEAAEVTTEKTLLELILKLSNLGKVRIDQPEVNIVLREDGSNLEDVFAAWLVKPPENPPSAIGLELEIVDGRISIEDKSSGQSATIKQLAVGLKLPPAATDPTELTATAAIESSEGSAPLSVKFTTRQTGAVAGLAGSSGSLLAKLERFPLPVCQALACRVAPKTKLAGNLQVDIKGEWTAEGAGRRMIVGQVGLRRLAIAGPCLAGDQLAMNTIDLPCQIVWEGDRLDVRQLGLTCDVGQMALDGTLEHADRLYACRSTADALNILTDANGQIAGQLDVAKLARQLPELLRVRSGTEVTGGTVGWQVASKNDTAGTTWTGNLDAVGLTALYQGRELAWKDPPKASFVARRTDGGLVIDQVRCESSFLDVTGKGNPNAFELSGQFDLSQLIDELGKFVDLGKFRLAGRGTIAANYACDPSGAVSAAAKLQVDQPQLVTAAGPWSEAQWKIDARLAGRASGQATRIDSAKATIDAGADQLTVTLRQAVENASFAASWPVQVQLRGQAQSWLARINGIAGPVGNVAVGGAIDLDMVATCSMQAIAIDNLTVNMKPLDIRGSFGTLDEPQGRLEASAKIDLAASRIADCKARLQTTSFSLDLTKGQGIWAPSLSQISGDLAYAGDLTRLHSTFHSNAAKAQYQVAGRFDGKATIQQNGWTIDATVDTQIDNLVVTPQGGQPWREGKVVLAVRGKYDGVRDLAELEKAAVTSDALSLAATGTIEKVMTTRELNLKGQSQYDLAVLTRLLAPQSGGKIQLVGRESRTFALNGPLSPAVAAGAKSVTSLAQLTGQASLGWQSANIYGFALGPATLETQLAGGIARLTPAQLRVNNGKVNLQGEVRGLDQIPYFTMSPGKVIDHVDATQEITNGSLAFIMPAVGKGSQARGQFSLDIDNCQIPVANPERGDVGGKVTVHSIEVQRGPLLEALSVVMMNPGAARIAQESVVQFRMVQGRIYHQGLELTFPEMVIRTHGSVGLDQSLAMIAEMTLPPKWIPGNGPLAETLRKEKIQLPISGTLAKPHIDPREIEKLIAQHVRDSSGTVIREGLNQGLNRLLGPLDGK